MTNNKIKINLDSLKSRREWKRHKVKDGKNVYRILPPFGAESNGYPYRKWQIIWGLMDPESGRARPFASSMTSEKRCPVTEYVAELKKKAETMKMDMQASGASEDAIKQRLAALTKLIQDLSPKTVYIYNAVDKSGEVGLLELKATAHKKMKTEMSNYVNDYNQDPTSLHSNDDDSGVWFEVSRTGMGRDTEYDVKKSQHRIKNGLKVTFEDDRSPLPEAVVENYDNMAYDLSSVYQVKSYEDLKAILDANMDTLIDMVPEADLNNATTVSATTAKTAKANTEISKPSRPTTPAKPVTTRFDDEDDTETAGGVDDDFLAQADALLNS